jgi:hypothetical protein
LDRVEEEQSVLVGDKFEVDCMNNGPDLPGSLAGGKKVCFDLVSNDGERVAVAQSKVGEEDGHKDWTPEDLVKSNLEGDRFCVRSRNLGVKPVVEVVSRRTMVEKTKGGKSDESLPVERTSTDKNLTGYEKRIHNAR